MDEKRKLGNFEKILKIFDANSIEKLNFYFIFYFIFRKFVTKNRAFGNNTSFLQQFFRFRGEFSPFPLATPLGQVTFFKTLGVWLGLGVCINHWLNSELYHKMPVFYYLKEQTLFIILTNPLTNDF